MVSQSEPPAVAPEPRFTALSMLLLGTEDFLAFWTASNRVGLPDTSPPPLRAATSMFLISLAKSLPRLASLAAFWCLVVAHLEWPLMNSPSRSRRTAGAHGGRPSPRGGRTWRAHSPGEPRRSYRRPVRARRGQGRLPAPRPPRPTAPG